MTSPDRQRVCKPSGVRWLPDLPTDWGVTPLKHLVEHVNRGESPEYSDPDGEHELLPTIVVNQACVQWDGLRLSNAKHQPSDIPVGKGLLHPGDVLVNSTGTGTLGRVQVFFPDRPDRTYMADSHVTIVRTQRTACEPRFLARLLSTPLFQGFVYSAITSGATNQIELSREGLARMPCIQPPIAEQTAIADFLDHETARIDALIEKQDRLVELLHEKRHAAISHAVVKGLSPCASMKDSGISWLGNIPDRWQLVRFAQAIDFQEGPGIMAEDFRDSGVPLLRISNLKEGYVDLDGCNFLAPEAVRARWGRFRLRLRDLLISSSASTGLVSEVGQAAVGAVPYTGIIRLRPRSDGLRREFIRWIVSSDYFGTQIDLQKTGSTIQHFGPTHLRQMFVVLPPVEEQAAIVQHLRSEVATIDRLLERASRIRALLVERRAALISAAVTGQIDVRHWSASVRVGHAMA